MGQHKVQLLLVVVLAGLGVTCASSTERPTSSPARRPTAVVSTRTASAARVVVLRRARAAPRRRLPTRIPLTGRVEFKTNTAVLLKRSYAVLADAARALKKQPRLRIEVQAHTTGNRLARY